MSYLVCDLDEKDKDHENKQVIKNTDCSNDDVDDLEYKIMDVGQIRVGLWRCGVVIPYVMQQRRGLHRYPKLSHLSAVLHISLSSYVYDLG